MEANQTPHFVQRQDYAAPDWLIDKTDLKVQIFDDHALCQVSLSVRATADNRPVILQGEGIELISVKVDGRHLSSPDYEVNGGELTIYTVPDSAVIEVSSKCNPYSNTALEGLYASNGMLCTQCEPEGFRRICYYSDRPDVMSVFTTHIEAPTSFINLLSNGNLIEQGEAGEGRHYALWHDPHPKPSYLFAMVAGDLARVEDSYITASGRTVDLHIYVEAGNEHLTAHAMASLKASMRWDEQVYGLEYDLDLFQIVAVSHFNMGAMENKGLNIFNSKFVLADETTATDDDLARVESIIAHEYFHNWTGNRVTCRDWFQLTLKEGLTVFRDQCFSADMHDDGVKRAEDVQMLRTIQFAEDASPTSHPIRPERYAEINNFYTPTIYEKGAEVIRMMHTLMGGAAFRDGMDIYFDRHDGQAVTCDDFLAALNDASQTDLSSFARWYSQAGTPDLTVSRADETCLHLKQALMPTAAKTATDPLPLPVRLALIGSDGQPQPFSINGGRVASEHVFLFDTAEAMVELSPEQGQSLSGAVPSVLRGFSAPVRLHDDLNRQEIAFLASHDTDPMVRYESFQRLFHEAISLRLAGQDDSAVADAVAAAAQTLLSDMSLRDDFKALALSVPGQAEVEQRNMPADPVAIFRTRIDVMASLGRHLHDICQQMTGQTENYGTASARALVARLLQLAVCAGDEQVIAQAETLSDNQNMTLSMAALKALCLVDRPESERALKRFHDRWKDDSLVIEKWFMMMASSAHTATVAQVSELMTHPAYDPKNPNKIRSVLGVFASANPVRFHAEDGSGYQFVTDELLKLDAQNPQIAARLGLVLTRFGHLSEARQQQMRLCLEGLSSHELSADLTEVVSKGLGKG